MRPTALMITMACLFACYSQSASGYAESPPWYELELLYPKQMQKGMQDAYRKWGVSIERVKATKRFLNDDAQVAWALYQDALQNDSSPKTAAMAQLAFDLGSKARPGYGAAVRSMELMASRHHRLRFFFFHKAAVIMEKWYGVEKGLKKVQIGHEVIKAHEAVADDRFLIGDDRNATLYYRRAIAIGKKINSDRIKVINDKLQQSDLRLTTLAIIKKEQQHLKDNIADIIAKRRLIDQFVVGMDDPFSAAEHLKGIGPTDQQKKMIPLAMKEIELLPMDSCLDLAQWYEGLSRNAKHPRAVSNMRHRAADYYERYLLLNTTKGLERDKIVLALMTLAPDRAGNVAQPRTKPLPKPVIKKDPEPIIPVPRKIDPVTKKPKSQEQLKKEQEKTQKTYTRRKSLRKDWTDLKEKNDGNKGPSFFNIPID